MIVKNLDLATLSVEEMNEVQMHEVDGGCNVADWYGDPHEYSGGGGGRGDDNVSIWMLILAIASSY